jgi:prepilin-type processing-associated H-X9-DG protein
MQQPSRTIVMFESGLPGEKPMPGQSAYFGRANGWAPDLAARYDVSESGNASDLLNSKTNVMFGDGHAETIQAKFVIAPGGGAYFPQLGTSDTAAGTVSWTLDPETNPNSN